VGDHPLPSKADTATKMTKIMIKSISMALLVMMLGVITSCITGERIVKDPKISSDDFDWEQSGPMELLGVLKAKGHGACPTYVIHGVADAWVTENHVSELISLLGSAEPCANVCRTISSFRDCNTSSVGREAAFLIEGFRRGEYPPDLNSGRAHFDKDEIISWWQNDQNVLPMPEQPVVESGPAQ
jgi:hypothetical protein